MYMSDSAGLIVPEIRILCLRIYAYVSIFFTPDGKAQFR